MKPGYDPSDSASRRFLADASVWVGFDEARPVRLAVETLLVTIAAIATVRWLHAQRTLDQQWLLIPVVLVIFALLPARLAKRDFPCIALDVDSARQAMIVTGLACVCITPVVFLGLCWMRRHDLPIPLDPAISEQPSWLGWLLYQFLYVAASEEVFFRGYVQNNVTKLSERLPERLQPMRPFAIVVASAGCFVLAHVAVQGRSLSLLTFFPGLLMAWAFLRTGSLFAPILIHGLANTIYGLAAALFS